MKRYILFLMILCLSGPFAIAQNAEGELKAIVKDDEGKPVPNAVVGLELEGNNEAADYTNELGEVFFTGLTPGSNYVLIVQNIDYNTYRLEQVEISGNKMTQVDVVLTSGEREVTVITTYKKPIIEVDKGTTGQSFTEDQIKKMPYRGINAILGTAGGVLVTDGGSPIVKGNRGGLVYYVDGQRILGGLGLPQGAISEMSVLSGGIPAEYGDATGGIITITTRGPSRFFYGGLEVITSQFLDPYGYNLIEGNLSGPLILRNKGTDSFYSILGFFVAGNASFNRASDPAFFNYKIQDDVLTDIQEDPLRQSPLGSGFVSNAEFVTLDQMEKTFIKPNTASQSYSGNFKLDFQPAPNINLTGGGQYNYSRGNAFIYTYSMFNYDNNPEVINNTYRGFLRFKQSFNTDTSSKISNAYYFVQVDYTRTEGVTQDPRHQDNYFNYGYLGKFERYRMPFYLNETRTVNDTSQEANYLIGYFDTLITFTPGGVNQVTENYTERYFDLEGSRVSSYNQIQSRGGLINGQSPQNVYSLWAAPGSVYGYYSKSGTDVFTLNATASATIGEGGRRHSLKTGLQYEQRTSRAYNVGDGNYAANGLWTLARQLTNSHLTQLDTNQPMPVYDENGNFTGVVNYPYQVTGAQSTFDQNLRAHLISTGARDVYGRPIDEQSFINVDRYGPDELDLSWFSANELLNNGNSYISYYGYDYKGNKLDRKPSIDDFLDSTQRLIAPYNPIYIAGYIQDKFSFEDIIFNVGVRVDRFDANQPVLRDPYSLYPTRQVGEIVDNDGDILINGTKYSRPGNVGDDYVVYVDDPTNPTRPVGFRSGDTWYNAAGAEIADPQLLALESSSGSIAPYLQARNPSEIQLSKESFKDYEPQVTIMPRISFSFPISREAVFFANYDVLTQRPSAANFATLDNYYYLRTRATQTIANPALKPERRTNYEIGFK
ncbi:MAG: TonB-dependent receptor, partial [Bacteroidota bacterium]|nr:TonB-dependent receptor [Bacteroidota bacterium]